MKSQNDIKRKEKQIYANIFIIFIINIITIRAIEAGYPVSWKTNFFVRSETTVYRNSGISANLDEMVSQRNTV